MGNNKSSLRSLITDNIDKVRSVKKFYDEVESTIQRELTESRAALKFYKKTFHDLQMQVEHHRVSEENLEREIASILKANSDLSKQIDDKILSLTKNRNPANDQVLSALKIVSTQIKYVGKTQGKSIKDIKQHSDQHIAMMKEMKKKFFEMTDRSQKNASKIQQAWKEFRGTITQKRTDLEEENRMNERAYEKALRELRQENVDSLSDSDSSSSSSVSSVSSIKNLQLYGGRKKLLRRRQRYKRY